MTEYEFDTQLVYAVDRDNEAAWEAIVKICTAGVKPGRVIPLTAAEFEALKSGVLVLAIPKNVEGKR